MRLIFLGPPGAGKGTQAALLAKQEGWPHVSTGDIFRFNLREHTPLGERIKSFMDRGELVPDALTVEVALDRLGQDDCKENFILDGFPRTVAQAEALDDFLAAAGSGLSAVIEVSLEDEEVVRRLTQRRSCKSCGSIYHLENSPPAQPGRCDRCGSELYLRDDDQEGVIRNRLEVYRRQTAPLVDYYRERGLLRPVDGRAGVSEVEAAIHGLLEVLSRP